MNSIRSLVVGGHVYMQLLTRFFSSKKGNAMYVHTAKRGVLNEHC